MEKSTILSQCLLQECGSIHCVIRQNNWTSIPILPTIGMSKSFRIQSANETSKRQELILKVHKKKKKKTNRKETNAMKEKIENSTMDMRGMEPSFFAYLSWFFSSFFFSISQWLCMEEQIVNFLQTLPIARCYIPVTMNHWSFCENTERRWALSPIQIRGGKNVWKKNLLIISMQGGVARNSATGQPTGHSSRCWLTNVYKKS